MNIFHSKPDSKTVNIDININIDSKHKLQNN